VAARGAAFAPQAREATFDSRLRDMPEGVAKYVPVFIARAPRVIRNGRVRVDVTIVQVTPPDALGYVSRGVSVDVTATA
jgi:acyl-CoA hydrolase